MTPARAGTSAVAAVLGAAVLLVVLVTWAASIGPDAVLTDEPADRGGPAATPSLPTGSATVQVDPSDEPPATSSEDFPGWVWIVVFGLELATLGVVVYLIYRLGLAVRERWHAYRRSRRADEESVEFEVLDTGRQVAAAIEEDATTQRELLEAGGPRNAIVACWRHFEVQAARAGVVRRPWQTPSEFVLWVLDLAGADAAAVTRLADLYREARFSDHPMGEQHRADAVAALDAVHRSLRGARVSNPGQRSP